MQEEPFKIVKDSPPSTVTSRHKWLSAINESRESIKNREYFLEFEPNSKSLQIPRKYIAWEEPFLKKIRYKNFVGLSHLAYRLVDKTFYTKNSIFMPQ
jgi:hypothetical protein